MSLFRKNTLFAVVMTVCAVIAAGELALIYERFMASRAAAQRLAQRLNELEEMSQFTPPPTREVADAIAADVEKAEATLAAMQAELKGRGSAAERLRNAKVPVARTDSYFDLASFVERMRALAKKQQVDIRPEAARFGFAAFANEGPVQEHIEPVFRQRQVAQYLIEALIAAEPRSILSVKRTRTLSRAEREAREAAIAAGETPIEEDSGEEGPDFFVIDPRVTARVPGFIDTMPFRFVFTGQTAALRNFLNQLASFELPVLVREVEVEMATAEESITSTPEESAPAAEQAPASTAASIVLTADAPDEPAAAPPPVRPPATRGPVATPIVSKPLSRFTVTVEFVELVPPAEPPSEEPEVEPEPATS